MIFSEEVIQHGSASYEQIIDLRYRILRKPLGMQFSEEQLAAERVNHHLALFRNDQPVACLMLLPVNAAGGMQMKQVAVDEDLQGMGLGARLVEFAERYAAEHGATLMFCHAREHAVPFYLRLGYTISGEPFEEIGIPHRYMEKQI